MKIYLVGGAVRDQLLGLTPKERDYVVVGSTPEEMSARGFKLVGQDFPVFLHPQTKAEYALARTERKAGRGYKGFTIHAHPAITLEEDLKRRDLTINAMAQDEQGHIIDPYGGQRDLQQGLLRHVSPAFAEDPLRILRIARFHARFAALGFQIAEETLSLLQQMVQGGELADLTPARIWQEVKKALEGPSPQQFFLTLRNIGALAVLFKEIDDLFGVPQDPKWHPEIDTGIHNCMVLEETAKLTTNPQILFAALLHDVGKGLTPQHLWPKHPDHETNGVPLIKNICQRFPVPKSYRDLAILVCAYHGQCHKALTLSPEEILTLLENLDAYRRPERFQEFLIACEGDARGRSDFQTQPYPQKIFLERAWQVTQIAVAPLLEEGLRDQELAAGIRERRLREIGKIIS